jgi:hypothetical protein
MVRPEVVNLPVNLVQNLPIKIHGIVTLNRNPNTVSIDIIDKDITGLPQYSQNILFLALLVIHSKVFHKAYVQFRIVKQTLFPYSQQ